jgi:hypothetical protein
MAEPEKQPSMLAVAKNVLQGEAGPVVWNLALFAAGVVFIQSSFMDFLAPQYVANRPSVVILT